MKLLLTLNIMLNIKILLILKLKELRFENVMSQLVKKKSIYQKELTITNLKTLDTISINDYDSLHITVSEFRELPNSINKFRHIKALSITGPITNISQIYNFKNLRIFKVM